MKNGTQMRVKYLVPYREKLFSGQNLSKQAEQRLVWMDYIAKGNSILKASRHFDIPEATIRYWKNRYRISNLHTLENQSKRPKRVRESEVPIEQAQRLIELRLSHRGWGKLKLQQLLRTEGVCMGQTRIQKIINRAGLKRVPAAKKKYYQRKNRRHMYAVPKEVLTQPGGLVYMDVKHLYLTGGKKVYQFTAIDHATRMLRIMLSNGISSRSGKNFLEYLTQEYPFTKIQYLGSDNGSEFLGELDQELANRKIVHVFSSPRTPKQNPFVERVIRTVIDEVYTFEGLEVSMQKQKERLERYVDEYNEVRPHHSLGLKTPMQMFLELTAANS